MKKAIQVDADLISIDLHRLDYEWVRQPSLFHKFAAQLSEARLQMNESKAALEVVAAELDVLIRQAPERFLVEGAKPTEKAIESAIHLQDKFQEAQRDFHRAKYTMDLLQATVDALDQRKWALQNLVTLRGQDYFAEPQVQEPNARERTAEASKRYARSKGRLNHKS